MTWTRAGRLVVERGAQAVVAQVAPRARDVGPHVDHQRIVGHPPHGCTRLPRGTFGGDEAARPRHRSRRRRQRPRARCPTTTSTAPRCSSSRPRSTSRRSPSGSPTATRRSTRPSRPPSAPPPQLRESGAQARATTGESEPLLALQDALATFPADRVLVFVRDEDEARYREDDVVGEAERRFSVPVTEVRG